MVTDYETFVSVLQPIALKIAVEDTAETFAPNNYGPRPYSPPSRSSHLRFIKRIHFVLIESYSLICVCISVFPRL